MPGSYKAAPIIRELQEEVHKPFDNPQGLPPFPVDHFPGPLSQILRQAEERLHFLPEFLGSAMLLGASLENGNAVQIEGPLGPTPGIIYLALVAPPGTGKTQPLSWALKPCQQADAATWRTYQQAQQEAQNNPDQQNPIQYAPRLCDDVTPEALAALHQINPRGLAVKRDELNGLIADFGRYHQSGESERWNSLWSAEPLIVNRLTREPLRIEEPHISLCGTLQPSVLKNLAGGNRAHNGFLDRFLFAFPPSVQAQPWSNQYLDRIHPENWASCLEQIRQIPFQTEAPQHMGWQHQAWELVAEWQAQNTRERNQADSETTQSVLAKLDIYILRLCLLMQLLRHATLGESYQQVSPESAQAAIALVNFYKAQALKVRRVLDDPTENLPETKRNWYNALPEQFPTKEAIELGKEYQIPKRTVMHHLKNQELFRRVGYGQYEKLH